MQQVNDSGHGLVGAHDGHHDGGDSLTELTADSLQAGSVVAVIFLGAVDEDHAGLLAQHLPVTLHTNGQTVLGSANQHGALSGADSAQSLTGEVEVAGCVHNVDLHVLIHDRGKSQRDRNLALDLFRIVVADGVAVGGLAQAIAALGHKEHMLSKRGLAGAAVTEQSDIANVISSHSVCSPFKLYQHGCFLTVQNAQQTEYSVFLFVWQLSFFFFIVFYCQ